MSRVLRCDSEGVGIALENLDEGAKMGSNSSHISVSAIVAERCDGNRNVLHACVAMCAPNSNKDESGATVSGNSDPGASLEPINVITNALSSKSVSLREMMRRATRSSDRLDRDFIQDVQPSAAPEEPIPTLSWPPESFEANSGDEDSLIGSLSQSAKSSAGPSTSAGPGGSSYVVDPVERRNNALVILRLLCDTTVLAPYLRTMLSAKDAQGHTPFMLAVSLRAYPAALAILDAIHKVGTNLIIFILLYSYLFCYWKFLSLSIFFLLNSKYLIITSYNW